MTDLIIGGGILLSAFAGWRSGLIGQIVSLVGVFIAYFLAKSFYLVTAPVFKQFIAVPTEGNSWLNELGLTNSLYNGISFVILFFVFLFAIRLLGTLLNVVVSLPGLSMVNRFSGLVVGFVLGVLVAGLLVNFLALVPSTGLQEALGGSQLAQTLIRTFDFLMPNAQTV